MLKETAGCKWLLIVIELFDIAISDFGAVWKTMLVLTELVTSNTQWNPVRYPWFTICHCP